MSVTDSSSFVGDKAEKLAQARKKLKNYQRLRRKSSDYGDDRRSSPALLSASRDSLDIVNNSTTTTAYSHHNQQQRSESTSSFRHDECRSAFERVRSTSSQQQTIDHSVVNNHQSMINYSDNDQSIQTSTVTDVIGEKSTNTNHQPNGDNVLSLWPTSAATSSIDNRSTPAVVETTNSLMIDELMQENNRLKNNLIELQKNYDIVIGQTQQLHSHYSQLHTAYTSMTESLQTNGNSQTIVVDQMRQQINQHCQTINVLVDEKTTLQSQLRQAMIMANEKHVENEELHGRLNANRNRLDELEKSTERIQLDRNAIETSLRTQKDELDKLRHEASQWEAKFVEMQQDRGDVQARLKVKCREIDRLSAELGDIRKQLQMKDIYIRQLSAHAAGVAEQVQNEDSINELHAQIEQLQIQLQQANTISDQWRIEVDHSRQQYESYGRQLNQNILQLSAQVEKLIEEKLSAESRVEMLQQQLTTMQDERIANEKAIELCDDVNDDVEDATVKHARQQLIIMELKNELDTMRQMMVDNQSIQQQLIEKSNELQLLRDELKINREQTDRLEQIIQIHDQCSSDSRSLLDQLQSEKATVSRAVSQNRELKEQLTELQDKLVTLSDESMERETKIQSANYAIEAIRKQYEAKEDAYAQLERDYRSVTDQLNSLMQNATDVEKLRNELIHERMEIDRLRNNIKHDTDNQSNENLLADIERLELELNESRSVQRRAINENEELHRIMQQNAEDENQNTIHVELQHAIDRINSLSTQNQQLKQQIIDIENRSLRYDEENCSNCSENNDQKAKTEPIASLQVAMQQLQERFTRAMHENANLSDKNQQLEHLIMQLQSETDTIGEYVTLYQHQRRMIRGRLRERDLLIAKLSREKDEMTHKLTELQTLIMNVLNDKGVLHQYTTDTTPKRGRSPIKSTLKNAPGRAKTRSYSHSTVDELSGDEHETLLVDGSSSIVPNRNDDTIGVVNGQHINTDNVDNNSNDDNHLAQLHHSTIQSIDDIQSTTSSNIDDNSSATSGNVERMLRLLNELQASHLHNSYQSNTIDGRNMHCKECRGKLIVL